MIKLKDILNETTFTDNGKKKMRNISWELQKYTESLEKAVADNDVNKVVNTIAKIKKTLKLVDKGWKYLVK